MSEATTTTTAAMGEGKWDSENILCTAIWVLNVIQ